MKNLFTIAACTVLVLLCLTAKSYAGEITVRGHLAATVESGGWLIVTDKDKYLLLNVQTFQHEKWFREGVRVEATGETKPDKFSIYQEGIPFEARTMKALQATRPTSVSTGSHTSGF